MFRSSRRRSHYGIHLCAAVSAAVLLLLSVSLLYTRLSVPHHPHPTTSSVDDPFASDDPLLSIEDSDVGDRRFSGEDRIDELDVVEEDGAADEEEILRGVDAEGEEEARGSGEGRGYFYDHVLGGIRRRFDRRSIDEIDRWDYQAEVFEAGFAYKEDRSKVAFGSDDVPVDEEVRRKVVQIRGIEDALLLKIGSQDSPLREGWGPWFDAKSDFLRKDRMFKSNLEVLNPLNNPLLQDPDGVSVTGLTRGDKLIQKGLLLEMKKLPFLGKKPLGVLDPKLEEARVGFEHLGKRVGANGTSLGRVGLVGLKDEQRYGDDRISDGDGADIVSGNRKLGSRVDDLEDGSLRRSKKKTESSSVGEIGVSGSREGNSNAQSKPESTEPMYAGRGRWGYFPGLPPYLSFSNFMDSFFRQSKCSMRVFMVWNSPPWMFTTRYQRGLGSLLFHHPDACVVVFSETIELDFFKEFHKDRYKIAVAMPNLEELLKDTPTSIFASVWYEWRRTKYYSTHYSELIRLAALYKYGGIYLDSDVIVLKPLSSFSNSVGMEEPSPKRLNGAVMAFKKHSAFLMDCLSEFYSTYDDTQLRWNGADLLSRVAGNFSSKPDELNVQPAPVFFPVSSHDIERYFAAPANDSERNHQDALFRKILDESYTFHFWSSLTSALVPEPDSLVARILNHNCIRCFDVL